MRTKRIHKQNVRARDAAVQDVAADRHHQPGDPALVAADGERVEQRLRGMFVPPSPALMTAQSTFCDRSCTAPAA